MSKHIVVTGIACPHCGRAANSQGFKIVGDVYLPLTRWRVVHCDPDEGGCDEHFSIEVKVDARVATYLLSQVLP